MTRFDLNLTIEEAALIVAALGFIRMNLAFSADTADWHFVDGKSITYDLHQVLILEDVKSKIYEALTEAQEAHPFAPFIRTF